MNNQDQKTITLAQWCAYVPYGVEVAHKKEFMLKGAEPYPNFTLNKYNLPYLSDYPERFKPLLRPMNDPKIEWLVDEVYNSKVYHTLHIKYWSHNNQFKQGDDIILIENLPNSLTQALRAAHYDLDNLIGQGLALPID